MGFAKELLNLPRPVSLQAVPYQRHLTGNLPQQLFEKLDDDLPGNIAFRVHLEEQPYHALGRTEAESCNDRDFPLARRAMNDQRSFPYGRRTRGAVRNPLSSTKMRCARRAAVFFYHNPRALPPAANLLVLKFRGTPLRSLRTPPQRMQHPSYVIHVVAHPELTTDYFRDPWAGPQVVVIAEGSGSFQKELLKLAPLAGTQTN